MGLLTLAKHATTKLSIRTDDYAEGCAALKEHSKVKVEPPTITLKVAKRRTVTRSGDLLLDRDLNAAPEKLMHAFCNRGRISVRFLFDGIRINETMTPEQLDMEHGDVIHVTGAPWCIHNLLVNGDVNTQTPRAAHTLDLSTSLLDAYGFNTAWLVQRRKL